MATITIMFFSPILSLGLKKKYWSGESFSWLVPFSINFLDPLRKDIFQICQQHPKPLETAQFQRLLFRIAVTPLKLSRPGLTGQLSFLLFVMQNLKFSLENGLQMLWLLQETLSEHNENHFYPQISYFQLISIEKIVEISEILLLISFFQMS